MNYTLLTAENYSFSFGRRLFHNYRFFNWWKSRWKVRIFSNLSYPLLTTESDSFGGTLLHKYRFFFWKQKSNSCCWFFQMVFTQRVQVTYTRVSSRFEFQVDFWIPKVRSSYGPLAYFSDILISGKNVVISQPIIRKDWGLWPRPNDKWPAVISRIFWYGPEFAI